MRILIVHSGNRESESNRYTFVKEQGDALSQNGCEVSYFAVIGKGVKGYLENYSKLTQRIDSFAPDVIHAHYGFSGALAVLQRKIPVVITFHNGETLTQKGRIVSSFASMFSKHNIYVAEHIYQKMLIHPKNYTVMPCGIWLDELHLFGKDEAMNRMSLDKSHINILFGGSFSNLRKNYSLAIESISLLNQENINLIELKGKSREEVNYLLCGCDMLLLTTKSEGSPQVIKEAMACNCPIVATNVADIPELLSGVSNSYYSGLDPNEISSNILKVIQNNSRTNGRDRIIALGLDNNNIANKLISIYKSIL